VGVWGRRGCIGLWPFGPTGSEEGCFSPRLFGGVRRPRLPASPLAFSAGFNRRGEGRASFFPGSVRGWASAFHGDGPAFFSFFSRPGSMSRSLSMIVPYRLAPATTPLFRGGGGGVRVTGIHGSGNGVASALLEARGKRKTSWPPRSLGRATQIQKFQAPV
jgi:hypothetical protein